MPGVILINSILSKKRSFGSVFFWEKAAFNCGLILLFLSWVLPNHYRPWPSFHSEMLAFAGVNLFVLTIVIAPRSKKLFIPKRIWPFISLIAIPWIQYIFGIINFLGDALGVTFYLVAALFSFVLGYHYKIQEGISGGALNAIMQMLLIAAVMSAAIGYLQWFSLEDGFGIFVVEGSFGGRVIGNLAQSNQLATLLLIGIVACYFFYEIGTFCKISTCLIVAFLSFALIATQSRSGFYGVIALAAFILYKRNSSIIRLPNWMIVVWVFLMCLGVWMLPLFSNMLMISDVFEARSLTDSNGRLLMWRQMISGLMESPWFGYGWNQSIRAQMIGAINNPGAISSDYAHNIFIDLLIWNGVPLGLTIAVVIFFWFVSRLFLTNRVNSIYGFACLIPFAVHSLVEFPFAYSFFLIPMFFMIGVIESESGVEDFKMGINWVIVKAFLFFWTAMGGCFVREYFLVEEDFRISRFEIMNISGRPANYVFPKIILITQMDALLKATRIQVKSNMSRGELDTLRQVSARFGYAALNYRYALALGLNDDSLGASNTMLMIKGMYGPRYYNIVKDDLIKEASTRYPQLALVKTP